jgi:hypothetical protein
VVLYRLESSGGIELNNHAADVARLFLIAAVRRACEVPALSDSLLHVFVFCDKAFPR